LIGLETLLAVDPLEARAVSWTYPVGVLVFGGSGLLLILTVAWFRWKKRLLAEPATRP
jgi:hypothetical protein